MFPRPAAGVKGACASRVWNGFPDKTAFYLKAYRK